MLREREKKIVEGLQAAAHLGWDSIDDPAVGTISQGLGNIDGEP